MDNLNPRLDASVESDIVGYSTIELSQEWTLVAVNLTDFKTDTVSVNDLFTSCVGLQDGDQLQVQNELNSYDLAYWNTKVGLWCNKGTDTPTSIVVKPGQGLWLKAKDGASHSVSLCAVGRIKKSVEDFSLRGYTIISIPVPLVDVSPNDARFAWNNLQDGDQLQIPNEVGSYNLAYWNASVGKWCNKGTTTSTAYVMPTINGCWLVTASANASFSFDMNK